jgi:hypothetical protein
VTGWLAEKFPRLILPLGVRHGRAVDQREIARDARDVLCITCRMTPRELHSFD